MKLLFAASELFPLIKTGGLADVAHSLPNALTGLKVDVRVVLPAYRQVLLSITALRVLGWLPVSGGREVRILEARHAEVTAPLWLVDAPAQYMVEASIISGSSLITLHALTDGLTDPALESIDLNVGFYSRRREVNQDSSFSVLG